MCCHPGIVSNVILTSVNSDGAIVGIPTSLLENWELIDGCLVGPGAKLSDAPLSCADLAGAYLIGADLSESNLFGVNFTGTGLLNRPGFREVNSRLWFIY